MLLARGIARGIGFRMKKSLSLTIILVVFFAGCLNMPTPESQITGTYVSPLKYKNYGDEDLVAEINSLTRREAQLKVAQTQRMKTSTTKAFWYGFGDGDGIEASELANIRGSIEAARRELERRELLKLQEKKPQ